MLITQRPIITQDAVAENRYKFTIEPLEPGFGYTLGNSLRRTLLSSIPGAAVTSIKIAGVKHEFETAKGVKEDVTDIILNVKDLVVSSEIDEPAVAYIKTDKAGPILAKDIKVPAGIKIHNGNLVLATLSAGNTFEAEFVIERGRGYVSADDNKKLNPNAEIDRIIVDSIYSPVTKVSYSVEATRVGQHTNFDKLVVDIETKPSTSPVDAIASAGKTLIELFGLVNSLNTMAEGVELGSDSLGFDNMEDAGDSDLDLLDIPNRARNVLRHEGISTVQALAQITREELSTFKSMGDVTIDAIEEALKEQGHSLAK